MEDMNRQWLALGLGITISVLTGCGEAEPSGGPTGTIRLSLTAVNSGNAALSVAESATLEKQNGAQCAATYQASFGHSGAPDSLTVHVRRIALASSESAPAILFESDDPAGAPLELDSGRLDLSALVSFDPE